MCTLAARNPQNLWAKRQNRFGLQVNKEKKETRFEAQDIARGGGQKKD